jgi:hypothetical protein
VANMPPGIRRLCVAFGIEPPDSSGSDEMTGVEQQVTSAFAEVCTSLGLDRMLLNRRDAGEEQVGLLPVGIDEPRVVSSLIEGFSCALAEFNNAKAGGTPVRVRLAFHEGITTLSADGFSGNAVAKVRRLAGSPHLRAALQERPHASLAVLLSDPVFEDIGRFGYSSLPPDQFQQVEIADSRREPCNIAWIYVPGESDSDRDQDNLA